MASSSAPGSRSPKRRSSSDDIDEENIVATRTRGLRLPPTSPTSPTLFSGRDPRALARALKACGVDFPELSNEYYNLEKESHQTSSELGTHKGWYPHQVGADPKYLCYRPQYAVPPFPVILLFEPLSKFADNLKKIPIKDEDLSFAQLFWDGVHSAEYVNSHNATVRRLIMELQRYCPDGQLAHAYRLNDGSELDGSGSAGIGKNPLPLCVWLEYKSEPGKLGDPYFQVLDYALKCDAEDRNSTVQTYGIAVCVSGPHLQVLAVTVVGEKVWADPLGIVQCCGDLKALEATARVWAAVRQFFEDYREVYGKFTAQPVPWPLKVHGELVVRMPHGKSLIYLYRNEQGECELAKFVQSYCEDAHKAWIPHAPEFRGISRIVDDWQLVRMEYLSGWCSVTEILKDAKDPKQIVNIIDEAVNRGHAAGFVHGDVRLPNILVREKADGPPAYEVKLLNFDWSGRFGDAKYPRRLSKEVEWPAGAAYGALICKEHDTWFARKLMEQLK